MKIPSQLTIGDSVSWIDLSTRDNLGNVLSSPDWILTYALRGPTVLDITGSQSNDGWKTEITASQSSDFKAGIYYWQAFVTKDNQRITIGSGRLTAIVNLFNISPTDTFDGRSQARKDLDAVEAAIRNLVSGGAVQEYKIGNRELKKMTIDQLDGERVRLKRKVVLEERAEKIKNGEGDPLTLKVGF